MQAYPAADDRLVVNTEKKKHLQDMMAWEK